MAKLTASPSPFHAPSVGHGVSIVEVPVSGALDMRLDPRNSAVVADALGASLPGTNTWVATANAHVLWQAFDEWLILTREGSQQAMAASLRGALSGMHCAITDVSDLRAAFLVEGAHAPDVLQKGCAVDLHPRVFHVGSCVTTSLARVRVTLRQIDSTPKYEVLVERSYGHYLWTWLADAAAEYVR